MRRDFLDTFITAASRSRNTEDVEHGYWHIPDPIEVSIVERTLLGRRVGRRVFIDRNANDDAVRKVMHYANISDISVSDVAERVWMLGGWFSDTDTQTGTQQQDNGGQRNAPLHTPDHEPPSREALLAMLEGEG